MRSDLAELLRSRRGHFAYESGLHGDLWLELETLFLRPSAVEPLLAELADRIRPYQPEVVCGPQVEGAFVALRTAELLDVEFIYANRLTEPLRYRLPEVLRELGGKRVAVVNDVISAGTAVKGALEDVQACGGRPVALGALLTLGDSAARLAQERGFALETLAREPSRMWRPADCPLCRAGEPVAPHSGT